MEMRMPLWSNLREKAIKSHKKSLKKFRNLKKMMKIPLNK